MHAAADSWWYRSALHFHWFFSLIVVVEILGCWSVGSGAISFETESLATQFPNQTKFVCKKRLAKELSNNINYKTAAQEINYALSMKIYYFITMSKQTVQHTWPLPWYKQFKCEPSKKTGLCCWPFAFMNFV